MKKIIAANWKMNGSLDFIKAYFDEFNYFNENAGVIFCPPYVYLPELASLKDEHKFQLGGQHCYFTESGAYTGDVSAKMLADVGCQYVILGHSERRNNHMESSQKVSQSAKEAVNNSLTPIICVGEDINAKNMGYTQKFLEEQLKYSIPEVLKDKKFVVAYEPIWAIGSGQSATTADIKNNHKYIRTVLDDLGFKGAKILYGGSVKPANANDILSLDEVDGVLVGGASLKPADFVEIIECA